MTLRRFPAAAARRAAARLHVGLRRISAAGASQGEDHDATVRGQPGHLVDSPGDTVACVAGNIAGDGEPTEAEVEGDKVLAVRVAVGFLTGASGLARLAAFMTASAFAPILEAIGTWAIRRLGRRRVEHAAETLIDGAEAAGMPLGEFIDRGVADERRHELFAKALVVAQDAAWRNKRRALACALANGVVGDDARIQQELLFVRAVDDIYEMDVRLLGRLADGSRGTVTDLVRADPGLADGLLPLLGNLQSHGLIDSRSPVTPGGAMTPEPYYFITDSGRDFLARLADDAELTSA